jgi:hypothetical protein
MPSDDTTVLNVRISLADYQRLREIADREERSMSGQARYLLGRALADHDDA